MKKIYKALFPGAIQGSPVVVNGGNIDIASDLAVNAQFAQNGASAAGGNYFFTSSATTSTLTTLGNAVFQYTAGSATTVTLDSAYNICKTLPQPLSVGQIFGFRVMTNAGTTIATPTLSDTAVTLAGTTTLTAAALRWYNGQVTQVNAQSALVVTAGTTFTSITQVGSTNNFTLALGTNAVSPVVGQAVYIQVTTGTLPTGWYPINKVTSATSFVIATPAGQVWTCTAAVVGGLTTLPTAGVYSPLITITGMMTTVTASMAV
jgi:hypothetical protein